MSGKKRGITDLTEYTLAGILCSYEVAYCKETDDYDAFELCDTEIFNIFLYLIRSGEVTMREHTYPYDNGIYDDDKWFNFYEDFASEAGWEMDFIIPFMSVRMNALRLLSRRMGIPSCLNGRFYYEKKQAVVECGDLQAEEIFCLFHDIRQLKTVYLFPYPYLSEDVTAVYYTFEPSKLAKIGMKQIFQQPLNGYARLPGFGMMRQY